MHGKLKVLAWVDLVTTAGVFSAIIQSIYLNEIARAQVLADELLIKELEYLQRLNWPQVEELKEGDRFITSVSGSDADNLTQTNNKLTTEN